MDTIKPSISLPAALSASASTPKSPLTASCSFHFSTVGSEQRLRAASQATQSRKNADRLKVDLDLETGGLGLPSHSLPRHFKVLPVLWGFDGQVYTSGFSTRTSWKLVVLCYSLYCVFVMSAHLVEKLHQTFDAENSVSSLKGTHGDSNLPLGSIPLGRLSRLLHMLPQPRAFHPFVLRGEATERLCACAWSQEEDLDNLADWANRWQGPISLLVVTSALPQSLQSLTIIKKVQAVIVAQPPWLRSSFSLHLLHVSIGDPHASPNAHLNLARLFSPSPRIVLFPGKFGSLLPPANEYVSALINGARMRRTPLILLPSNNTVGFSSVSSFPFHPLSPVILDRDDALWPTERFFYSESRAEHWELFLWRLWMENIGEVQTASAPEMRYLVENHNVGDHDGQVEKPEVIARSARQAKMYRRLSSRYRLESCALLARQYDAVGGSRRKFVQWLMKNCGETIGVMSNPTTTISGQS